MFRRVHAIAALALIALVALAPAGMWTYAKLASEDRDQARKDALRIVDSAPPPTGARRVAIHAYEERAWNGENFVPIAHWRFELAYRLARPIRADAVADHYRRVLKSWSAAERPVDCATISAPFGCHAHYIVFRRGRSTVELNLAEYIGRDGKTVTEYGLSVSQ